MVLLEEVFPELKCPVWVNADILPGPGGQATPLEPQSFLAAISSLSSDIVLSLGWTTGWTAGRDNPGEVSRSSLAETNNFANNTFITFVDNGLKVSYNLLLNFKSTCVIKVFDINDLIYIFSH